MTSELLSEILSAQYAIINYRDDIIQQSSRTYLSCIPQTLCMLVTNSQFLLLPVSILLAYMSVFTSVPYCLNYCHFVICFEIRMCDSSSFLFLPEV